MFSDVLRIVFEVTRKLRNKKNTKFPEMSRKCTGLFFRICPGHVLLIPQHIRKPPGKHPETYRTCSRNISDVCSDVFVQIKTNGQWPNIIRKISGTYLKNNWFFTALENLLIQDPDSLHHCREEDGLQGGRHTILQKP